MLEFNEPNLKGPIKQPCNAVTGIIYFLLGILIFNQDSLIALAIMFVSITTIIFHATHTLWGEYLDLFSMAILAIVLLSKAFPFTNLNNINLLLGGLIFILAFIFWLIDFKKSKLIPKNHIMTGHGIWHILTAVSVWFIYMSIQK
jgi:hypothetical protein